jgi:hypothetical protein
MISEIDIRDMKLEQVLQMHKQLEKDIMQLLNTFIKNTSLVPAGVDFRTANTIGSGSEVVAVKVNVEL